MKQVGKLWVVLALSALALVPVRARAQQSGTTGTISGVITDSATGQPVQAAQVNIVGTTVGVISNEQGRYLLRGVPDRAVEVRVLRVGYSEQKRTVTVPAGGRLTVDFAMRPVAISLTPVVTTATGTQRRVEIGNSISNINAAKVAEEVPTRNVADLLTARAPGVQVLPGNFAGSGSRVRIRGTSSLSLSNDPIYIIDGIRMTSNGGSSSIGVGGTLPSRANDINPDDIENIEIVKGPSAATLYGTDAANGVVLITTKRGRAGKTKFDVWAEQGLVQDRNDYPAGYTLAGHTTAANGSAGSPTTCVLTQIAAGTCVADSLRTFSVYKDDQTTPLANGYKQQYGVSASGGSDIVRYFAAGEYEGEVGVLKTPEFELKRFAASKVNVLGEQLRPNAANRASFRANLNVSPTPNSELAISTNYINLNQRLPQSDNNITGVFFNAIGGPGYRDTLGTNGYRAYTPGDIFQESVTQTVNRFIGSVSHNWHPTEWLSTRANVGTDFTDRLDTDLCRFNNCAPFGTSRQGFAVNNRTDMRNTTVDLGATGSFTPLSWLSSRTTVGAQYVNYKFDRNGASSQNLPPGTQTVGAGATQFAASATDLSKTLGLFVEEAVAVNDRIFVTGGLRTDQNSAFGTKFHNVVYPKASVSYVISDEGYFPQISWLSQLRLRSAYGASGTQPGSNDALRFFSARNVSIAGADQPAVVFNAVGNANLKPERATEYEGGIDARLFNNRANLELTYYSKVTKDALIARIIPPSAGSGNGTGGTTRFENLGSVKNAGLEALLNVTVVDRPTVGWDVTLNGSTNANRLVSLGGVPPQITTTLRQIAGYPLNGYWQRKIRSYGDINSDGIISANEVVVDDSASFMGYSIPRNELSLTNGVDLFRKTVRVVALFDYKGGHRLYNNTERFRCNGTFNCAGRYDPDASLWEQARAVALTEDPSRTFAGYMEKADFVRFRELSVTYRPDVAWSSRIFRANDARVTFAARNLHLWTKYTGIDPETNYNSGGNAAGAGEAPQDFFTLAPQTYFTLRVNVGF